MRCSRDIDPSFMGSKRRDMLASFFLSFFSERFFVFAVTRQEMVVLGFLWDHIIKTSKFARVMNRLSIRGPDLGYVNTTGRLKMCRHANHIFLVWVTLVGSSNPLPLLVMDLIHRFGINPVPLNGVR